MDHAECGESLDLEDQEEIAEEKFSYLLRDLSVFAFSRVTLVDYDRQFLYH